MSCPFIHIKCWSDRTILYSISLGYSSPLCFLISNKNKDKLSLNLSMSIFSNVPWTNMSDDSPCCFSLKLWIHFHWSKILHAHKALHLIAAEKVHVENCCTVSGFAVSAGNHLRPLSKSCCTSRCFILCSACWTIFSMSKVKSHLSVLGSSIISFTSSGCKTPGTSSGTYMELSGTGLAHNP